MTIRRKLLLSNILVIVFPTLVVLCIGLIIFFSIFGLSESSDTLTKSSRINCLSEEDAKAYLENGTFKQVPGNVTAYRDSDNTYIFTFTDTSEMPFTHEMTNLQRHSFTLGIMACTIIIFLLNRLLAKRIMKSIVTPLDVLTNGVREISMGNLNYRIEYNKNDEFSSVCTAFNDMATRLLDMTLLQQKEELNRKVLIAGISHDLRTPLTSIKAYVVGLETGVAVTPVMQKKYLSTINQKASELEYIINQLFLFSKLDVGDFPFQMEPANIGIVLEQLILDMQDEYLQKGVSIVYSSMPTNAVCIIDAIQFSNVIQNIWSNTAKYKNKPEAISTVSYEIQEENLLLSIADDGPGVPEDALDKMFEVFYRTDTSRQNVALGSGLGLAISAKIINRFGGTITSRNLSAGGLCIDIVLPLTTNREDMP